MHYKTEEIGGIGITKKGDKREKEIALEKVRERKRKREGMRLRDESNIEENLNKYRELRRKRGDGEKKG